MADEFIDIKNIDSVKIDDDVINSELDLESCQKIYQCQSDIGDNQIIIKYVGVMREPHDVLIRQIILPDDDKHTYYMISKLYTMEQLQRVLPINRIEMITINICNKNGSTINPIAYLSFNFIFNENIKNNLIDNTSETNINNAFTGHFSIYLHFNNKYVELQKLDQFCGNLKMMTKLTKWLMSDFVKNITA